VPGKDDEAPSPRKPKADARYRRPPSELIGRAARKAVRGGRASFPSLLAFRAAVLEELRRDEPQAALGGRRLRRLLVGVPGVRLSVRYTEKPGLGPPDACPVCGSELGPVRNRTLTGETVVLGRECRRCSYWTHGSRRVPVRYAVTGGTPRRTRSVRPPP
jgi:ribosomal protein L34E